MTDEQRCLQWELEKLARFQAYILISRDIAIAVTQVIETIEQRLWPRRI